MDAGSKFTERLLHSCIFFVFFKQGNTKSCIRHQSFPMYRRMSFYNYYHIYGDSFSRFGCRRECTVTEWTFRCCKNHYGMNCHGEKAWWESGEKFFLKIYYIISLKDLQLNRAICVLHFFLYHLYLLYLYFNYMLLYHLMLFTFIYWKHIGLPLFMSLSYILYPCSMLSKETCVDLQFVLEVWRPPVELMGTVTMDAWAQGHVNATLALKAQPVKCAWTITMAPTVQVGRQIHLCRYG